MRFTSRFNIVHWFHCTYNFVNKKTQTRAFHQFFLKNKTWKFNYYQTKPFFDCFQVVRYRLPVPPWHHPWYMKPLSRSGRSHNSLDFHTFYNVIIAFKRHFFFFSFFWCVLLRGIFFLDGCLSKVFKRKCKEY